MSIFFLLLLLYVTFYGPNPILYGGYWDLYHREKLFSITAMNMMSIVRKLALAIILL